MPAPTYVIGDLLTGRRIQTVNVLKGPFGQKLNEADDLSATVSLRDPQNRRLGLYSSATPGKSFLAALVGDTVMAAGPIWFHDWDDDTQQLTMTASGMWSYFDHRALLPVLAGRLPSDATTNTIFRNVSDDPDDPWPTDTSKSLQGIARTLVAQAQSWTGGNVPVILPAEIPGDDERSYIAADLAMVGDRLRDLTSVDGGPDIDFTPRLTEDRLGIEWVMRIGTPTQPLIFGQQEPIFNLAGAVKASTVSKLKVKLDGTTMASQAFAAGGRQDDTVVAAQSTDPALPDAGYPLLDVTDTSHSTVSNSATLQSYTDELVVAGRRPQMSMSFTVDANSNPRLGSYWKGDFCKVRVREHVYLPSGDHRMRIAQISGDEKGQRVQIVCLPEVV